MAKMNCWEFKKCGREPGGAKVKELGICIATQASNLDGVHGGIHSGRACWVVAGTLCGGKVQGSFAEKLCNCMSCDFYKTVCKEEGPMLAKTKDLLDRNKAMCFRQEK